MRRYRKPIPIRRREVKPLPRPRYPQEGSLLERRELRNVTAMGFTADFISDHDDEDEDDDNDSA